MERTYYGHTITKNLDGKYIVTYRNGSHSQHRTLADAKDAITRAVGI